MYSSERVCECTFAPSAVNCNVQTSTQMKLPRGKKSNIRPTEITGDCVRLRQNVFIKTVCSWNEFDGSNGKIGKTAVIGSTALINNRVGTVNPPRPSGLSTVIAFFKLIKYTRRAVHIFRRVVNRAGNEDYINFFFPSRFQTKYNINCSHRVYYKTFLETPGGARTRPNNPIIPLSILYARDLSSE